MFSISVEEVFQISNRKGVTLIGKTSGIVNIGDYLVDSQDRTKQYKVIGLETVHYLNSEKDLTHNPAVIIEIDTSKSIELKDKILESK